MASTSTTTSTAYFVLLDGIDDIDAIQTYELKEIKTKALKWVLKVEHDYVSDWDEATTGVDEKFVNEWWEPLHAYRGDLGDDDEERWIQLAKKYHPDVRTKITKSPVPPDFPPVFLELVEKAHDIHEEMEDKESDYLDYLMKKYPEDYPKYLFQCEKLRRTFLLWLYAKKFPGKSVGNAVTLFMEKQVDLFKARKGELEDYIEKCKAGLASCENIVQARRNKKRKLEQVQDAQVQEVQV
jgi:hypothetical protein